MEKTAKEFLVEMFQKGEAFYNEKDIIQAMEEYASQKLSNQEASEEEKQKFISDMKKHFKETGGVCGTEAAVFVWDYIQSLPKAQQNALSEEKVIHILTKCEETFGEEELYEEWVKRTAKAICSLAIPTAQSEEVKRLKKEVKMLRECENSQLNLIIKQTEELKSSPSPQALEKAKEVLEGYAQWEADIISEDKLWWPQRAKDVLTGKLYDSMIELQEKRKEALTLLSNETSK